MMAAMRGDVRVPGSRRRGWHGWVGVFAALITCAWWPGVVRSQVVDERSVAGQFRHLSIEQGLPNLRVFDLAEDLDGFLWVATQNGLGRFDGHEFIVFDRDHGPGRWLPDPYVTAVESDTAGDIWIGTFTGFIGRLDPRRLHWKMVDFSVESSCVRQVDRIVSTADGSVLIGGEFGVYRLRAESESGADEPSGGSSGGTVLAERILGDENCEQSVMEMQVGDDGTVWIAVNDEPGLYAWHADRGLSAHDEVAPLNTLCADHQGQILLAPKEGSLLVFDPRVGQASPDDRLSWARDQSDSDCLVDRQGTLWLSAHVFSKKSMGLVEVNDLGRAVRHLPDRELPGRLMDEHYLSMFEDRNGVLWFGGLSRGLDRLDRRQQHVEWILSRQHRTASLAASNVLSIAETPDGGAWVGFLGAGVQRLDAQRRPMQHIAPSEGGLRSGYVWDLVLDEHGTLWIAHENGIDRLSGVDGGISAVAVGQMPEGRVVTLHEAESGELWVGGSEFLGRLDRSVEPPSWQPLDPPELPVLSMADSDNGLWVGFDGAGLGWWDRSTGAWQIWDQQTLGHGVVSSLQLLPDLEGQGDEQVLVSTLGAGLVRFDRRGGVLARLTVDDGLSSNAIKSVLLEPTIEGSQEGPIAWATSEDALHRVDVSTGEVRRFETGAERVLGFATKAAEQGRRLWFGTKSGLVSFRPHDLGGGVEPPPAALTWLEIQHRRVGLRPEDPRSPLERLPHRTSSIELGHRDRVVSIGFTALDFGSPERQIFRYRLRGFDETWVLTDASERFARYSSLPPGRYRFMVQASLGDEAWGPTAELAIRVHPAWWRSSVAYGVYGLLAALLLGRIYLKQRRQVKTLGGLLPICASCKKIRDDEGYWQEVEAYVSDHSSAHFSHGLCPSCFDSSMQEVESTGR